MASLRKFTGHERFAKTPNEQRLQEFEALESFLVDAVKVIYKAWRCSSWPFPPYCILVKEDRVETCDRLLMLDDELAQHPDASV